MLRASYKTSDEFPSTSKIWLVMRDGGLKFHKNKKCSCCCFCKHGTMYCIYHIQGILNDEN